MITRTRITRLIAAALLLTGLQAIAREPIPSLSANPFEQPVWLSKARDAPAGDPDVRQRERIDLRATLTAGKNSLADVGGKIVGVGEEVDGYLLISISEGMAVFKNDDEIIRVSVISDDKDENDNAD